MIEVEIKIPLTNRNELEEMLESSKFVKGRRIREADTYFNSDYYNLRKMDQALRVRCCENLLTGEVETLITYKGPKMDEVSMTRKELETEVGDASICIEMIQALGFYIISNVDKIRQYYHRNNVALCLDQVDGLGDFLELEILAENESDKEQALDQLYDILSELGLKKEDTIQTSYLAMLCNK